MQDLEIIVTASVFTLTGYLTYLNHNWQKKEAKKLESVLSQRRWKVGELFEDAQQRYKSIGGDASVMNGNQMIYKRQIVSGYLNSLTPLSVDSKVNDCLFAIESDSKDVIAQMSKSKMRIDGKRSNLVDLVSRKRDEEINSSFRVITSGNYILTNDQTQNKNLSISATDSKFTNQRIPLNTDALQSSLLSNFSWITYIGNNRASDIEKNLKSTKQITPTGGALNLDKMIIPSIIPLLTTMQFPFYTETGIKLAKSTFKIGVKTNLPIWVWCDINYSTLNGSLNLNDKNLKVFLSWDNLKSYLSRKVASNSFWKQFFGWVTFFVGTYLVYKLYKRKTAIINNADQNNRGNQANHLPGIPGPF